MSPRRTFLLGILAVLYIVASVVVFVGLARCFTVSDISDVGQLFAEVILLPTVIVGFWITIQEFRKSQTGPILVLEWTGDVATRLEKGVLILEMSEHCVSKYHLNLLLRNEGQSISTWYRIAFEVPHTLAAVGSDSHRVQWHRGDKTNCTAAISTEMTRHQFDSNGQYGVFPGDDPIHIASLDLSFFPAHPPASESSIPHSVVTDKTPIQRGRCQIAIRPVEHGSSPGRSDQGEGSPLDE
jgi:hypothetical protein